MKLLITEEVKQHGINAIMAIVSGAAVSNRSRPLEDLKKEVIEKTRSIDIVNNQILEGYRELYPNRESSDYVPPAEHLIEIIKKNGRFPNINTVVDSYNLVSVKTFLSIGAHDTSHINGDVVFRITNGSEQYTSLGANESVKVSAGEYACMDADKILCRFDLRQCNETKITKETKEFIVYVQGNKNVELAYLESALKETCDLITKISGGSYQIIHET